jgi:hypothetical protein
VGNTKGEYLTTKGTKEYFKPHSAHQNYQLRKKKGHIVLPFGKVA